MLNVYVQGSREIREDVFVNVNIMYKIKEYNTNSTKVKLCGFCYKKLPFSWPHVSKAKL